MECNPTSEVMVINFATEQKLVILADEVPSAEPPLQKPKPEVANPAIEKTASVSPFCEREATGVEDFSPGV